MWGVVLLEVSDSRISNAIVIHNSLEGVYLGNTSNIHIANTTAAFNRFYGMHLWYMFNTYISYTTATHNGESGMFLDTMDDVHITNTIATHNSWNGMSLHKMNNTYITNIMLTFNGRGDYYGGVVSSGQVMITLSAHTQIYNSSFTDVNAPTTATTADPNSQPAIIVLYRSTLHISECHFTGNHISAIRGGESNIIVSGNLTFSSNRAFAGTAFILSQDSVLSLAENSHMYFINNHACNSGGMFYIVNNMNYTLFHSINDALLKYAKCFLHIEGSRSQERLTFVNNSAAMGGDILYGGDMAFGLDGQWNCLNSSN